MMTNNKKTLLSTLLLLGILISPTVIVAQEGSVRGGNNAGDPSQEAATTSSRRLDPCAISPGACGSQVRPPTPFARHEWSGRTQDQAPPANCGSVIRSARSTATGFRCFGSNCSAMEVRCTETRDTHHTDRVEDVYWTNRFSEESRGGSGQQFCNHNYFVTGVSCDGSRCDNLSLECTKVFGRAHIQSTCRWTSPFNSNNGGEITLPDGEYVRGMDCDGSYCETKRLFVCQDQLANNRPNLFEDRDTPSTFYTDRTTDGLEPVTCGSKYTLGRVLVNGFQCFGDNCDDVELRCHRHYQSRITDTVDHVMWTHMFSEETAGTGQVVCPDDHFLTGIHCDGHDCDNLSMECTRTVGRRVKANSCRWTTQRVSEENGGLLYIGGSQYPNKFVRGIDCDNGRCDNKRLYVCEPEFF